MIFLLSSTSTSSSPNTVEMLWSQLLALCAAARFSFGSPLAERYTTLRKRHSWDAPPRGWEFHSVPDAGEVIELRIGLRQGRVDELISSLYEVSEPGHHRLRFLYAVYRDFIGYRVWLRPPSHLGWSRPSRNPRCPMSQQRRRPWDPDYNRRPTMAALSGTLPSARTTSLGTTLRFKSHLSMLEALRERKPVYYHKLMHDLFQVATGAQPVATHGLSNAQIIAATQWDAIADDDEDAA
ncbi:hypothetical protein BDZ89DRAFT_1168001 [Hymenopellis radicata]|nr:hypothetical protein BDZ89DRAFT_1168001 [Hymenopellis radicata]